MSQENEFNVAELRRLSEAADVLGEGFGDWSDMLAYLCTHRERIIAMLTAADAMEDALHDAFNDCTENQPTYSAAIKAYQAAKCSPEYEAAKGGA